MIRCGKLCAAGVLALLSAASHANIITIDPNAQPLAKVEAKPVDTRMAQKITYSGGYKRLHQVTEDLARITGVTIRCGKDEDDWPVRDLPVTVYANDIPADKLLQAVADATHTLLSLSTVKGKNYYRVWKDGKRQKMLENRFQVERQYAKDTAEWGWDALVRLKDLPDSALGIDPSNENLLQQLEDARAIGPILEQVDKTVLDQAAVKSLLVEASDLAEPARSALIDAVHSRYESERKRYENSGQGRHLEPLTAQDLQRSYFLVQTDAGDYSRTYVSCGYVVDPDPKNGYIVHRGCNLADLTSLFRSCKDPRIPPAPRKPDHLEESRFDKDFASPNLKPIETDSDWDTSLLNTRVKPEKPKDKQRPRYADALEELSKASGCTIVCEDFLSHRGGYDVGTILGREATIGDILKSQTSNRWLVDEDARLIVGWDKWWCEGHWRMMPESVLVNLHAKLNSTGVELDDLTPITRFTKDQAMLWMLGNRDLEGLFYAWTWADWLNAKVWAIYDSLSVQDKALARSDAGLPLAKLDPMALSAVFTKTNMRWPKTPEPREAVDSAERVKDRLPTDPEVIARLSMKVVKRRPETVLVPDAEAGHNVPVREVPTPAGFYKCEYSLRIVGDGVDEDLGGPPQVWFPVYSPKREAEIDATRDNSDNKPSPQ